VDTAATQGTSTVKASTTVLRFRRRIAASPERVFQAWTRPEALKLWWCPAGWHPAEIEVDLRVGGAYRIAMRRPRGNGAGTVAVHGHFLQIEPGASLVYTWRWQGAFPDMPETQVTVEFRAVADGTEIVLAQADMAVPFCTHHLGGWLEAISRMQHLLSDRERCSLFGGHPGHSAIMVTL
jgi:uncharacterized protein YndB with AHSA1/START domain